MPKKDTVKRSCFSPRASKVGGSAAMPVLGSRERMAMPPDRNWSLAEAPKLSRAIAELLVFQVLVCSVRFRQWNRKDSPAGTRILIGRNPWVDCFHSPTDNPTLHGDIPV